MNSFQEDEFIFKMVWAVLALTLIAGVFLTYITFDYRKHYKEIIERRHIYIITDHGYVSQGHCIDGFLYHQSEVIVVNSESENVECQGYITMRIKDAEKSKKGVISY